MKKSKSNNDESYVNKNIKSLCEEFIDVEKDIVSDIYYQCDKDCELARNELYSLIGKKRKEEPKKIEKGEFLIEEIEGDLFSVDDEVSLCHCVSEDLAMGKGIAVLFKNKFGNVNVLKAQKGKIGNGAVLKNDKRFIYYLITKAKYFNKPNLEELKSSIIWCRNHMINNNVKTLAMPKIGCGLDGLKWQDVKKIIIEVFEQTNINIKVFTLPQKIKN